MKVLCSMSLLLRLAFWLSMVILVAGVALGHQEAGPAPADRVVPVVAAHGGEAR